MLVGGIGGVGLDGNVKNSDNWAPRVGVAYQFDDSTVVRAGYGRSCDIGVFGSLFGGVVTQNLPVLSRQQLNAPSQGDAVFTLSDGPPPPAFVEVGPDGRFPLPDQVSTPALRDKQRLPAVDAWNVTLQRQLSDSLSLEVGYVGNRGARVFVGDDVAPNANEPTIDGFTAGVPIDERRPFFAGLKTPNQNLGGAFGWTQGVNFYCICGINWYNSLQAKLEQRFSQGLTYRVSYTLQRARGEGSSYFFWDRTLEQGPRDWDRTHNLVVSAVAELPFGRGRRYGGDVSPLVDGIIGGWQFNVNYSNLSGMPFNVDYRGASADRDVGPNRPDLIGDPDGPKTRDQWFNATPIGEPGSAFGRPAAGTFGSIGRNELRGPSFWQVDASVFKNIRMGGTRQL
ncbi:MAG: hypothetical protein GEU99_25965 [Luteitalea sp.]|nr:hypothetical protein [Luteitalea sp.]